MLAEFILKLSEKSRKSLKFLLTALILAVILYPKFPFLTVPGIYVAIRLEDFLLLTIFLATFLVILPKWKDLLKNDIELAIILFLGVTFLSTLSGIFLTKTVVWYIGVLNWGRRLEYFVPFFAAYEAIKGRRDLEYYIKVLFLAEIFVFIVGVGQKYFGWPIITTQNLEYAKGLVLYYSLNGHLVSTFAGHYDMASFMILILPISLALTVVVSNWKSKLALSFVGISGLWLLANSASRISIVSYLAAVGITFLAIRKYKMLPIVFLISLIIFGTSENLLARYLRVFSVGETKIMQIMGKISTKVVPVALAQGDEGASDLQEVVRSATEDRSSSIRFNVEWPRAIRALRKNSFLGTGYSSITLATDGQFLRILGELGILGLSAFGLIFLVLVRKYLAALSFLKKINLETIYLIGFGGAIVGVLINSLFIDIFDASKFAIIFWLMSGMAIATIDNLLNYKE